MNSLPLPVRWKLSCTAPDQGLEGSALETLDTARGVGAQRDASYAGSSFTASGISVRMGGNGKRLTSILSSRRSGFRSSDQLASLERVCPATGHWLQRPVAVP